MPLKGVLLDVDGTLVDSNDAHAAAWEQAFREYGYDVPFDKLRSLIGMGGDKLMPECVPGLSDEESPGKDLSERRAAIFQEGVADLKPTKGARALVERLKQDGFKVVAASSAKQEELGDLLKAANVEDLLEEATTSSDAEQSKPEGDIVQAALDRAGLRPDEAVLIGDTPYDIESASKAGVRTIAVRSGGWDDDDLKDALAIYEDPADLLEHYEQSVLRQSADQVGA